MKKRISLQTALLALVAPISLSSPAQATLAPETMSLRVGDNAGTIPEDFDSATGALRGSLPWRHDGDTWTISSHWEFSASYIRAGSDDAWLFTLGPSAVFQRDGWDHWEFEFGVSPGWVTNSRLDDRDLGGHFQFTSHLGVFYRFDHHWRLGYRIQHTSNAKLYSENDGFDLQMLELQYRF